MTADRKWVERNLGFDPIAVPPLEFGLQRHHLLGRCRAL
jgi:hypothetical protein